jgi:hypothetical protein
MSAATPLIAGVAYVEYSKRAKRLIPKVVLIDFEKKTDHAESLCDLRLMRRHEPKLWRDVRPVRRAVEPRNRRRYQRA